MSAPSGQRLADTIHEQLAVKKTGPDEFVSVLPPGRMGNSQPIAYGGCTSGVAVRAACETVPSHFQLYSVLGYFLGPSLIDRPLQCKVYRTRDTKSFATRRVLLSQKLDNGSERSCLELTADFQAAEPAIAYTYSPPSAIAVKGPHQTPTGHALRDSFIAKGLLDPKRGALYDDMFALMAKYWEWRPCPEGVTGQNCSGFVKKQPTDQDDRHISDRVSIEWQRATGDVGDTSSQMAALAFNMDGGLSFLPLLHDHKFLGDVGACSSLDFALRIFTDKLDLTKWHLKERRTIAAQGGRTYSEARLFDEEGNLLAIESQQCIMRPLPPKKSQEKL